jgi:hypothetical protein
VGDGEQRIRDKFMPSMSADDRGVDQPCVLEQLQMLRSRGSADRQQFGQLPGGRGTLREPSDHPAPRRVSDSDEYGIKFGAHQPPANQ